MGKTNIEWADAVWNPITGCTKVSAGCAHCYAERMSKRLRGRYGYPGGVQIGPADDPFRVTLHSNRMYEPIKWKKGKRIFVCSMGDLFHEDVPVGWICHVLDTIQRCPQHTFLILTKRPERMRKALYGKWDQGGGHTWQYMEEDDYFPHVHLGVSVEDQATADERIPLLLQTPAAKRFVSIEPMLGPVDLRQSTHKNLSHRQRAGGLSYSQATRLDGVILGGETGPGARPMHPDWPRKVRDDCKAAGVPFFFKQWGAWWNGLHWSQQRLKSKLKWGTIAKNGTFYPRMTPMAVSRKYGHDADWWCKGLVYRVGKKAAGRILDGREYREVTE